MVRNSSKTLKSCKKEKESDSEINIMIDIAGAEEHQDVKNHSQDHKKLLFHTYMELVYVNIRTCKQACLVHWTSLCKY